MIMESGFKNLVEFLMEDDQDDEQWYQDIDMFSDLGNEFFDYPSFDPPYNDNWYIPVELPPLSMTFEDVNEHQHKPGGLPVGSVEEGRKLSEEEDNEKKFDNERSSKNLVSERSRRKRLNQQLFTLRSIVPNITKMDKRSILIDALAYLRSILNQTQNEMDSINNSSSSTTIEHSSSIVENMIIDQASPSPYEPCADLPTVSKIGVEKMDDERFILKIEFNKALGAMGKVQRLVEMLGMDIGNISVYEQDEHHMETMNFLRIKKKGQVLTEEDLLHRVQKNTKELGLHFVMD